MHKCFPFVVVVVAALVTSVPAYSQAPIPAAPAPRTVTSVASPKPTVSSVMDAPDGMRLSKVIGVAVYDDQGNKIGSVDDLIVRLDAKVSVAILSVGGFLGVDTKLVSVPYSDIRIDGGRLVLPQASKEALSALPAYSYVP
jgi:sporulation protein YlmC with PRC-barrel domain